MTLGEMKKKVLTLIEEYDSTETSLTADIDIAGKINFVINQIQNELARYKKIPFYLERDVLKGIYSIYELTHFTEDEVTTSIDVYQTKMIRGIDWEFKADGEMVEFFEDGTAEIEGFKYPSQIDDTTADTFKFDLSRDVLEIMPYGVAGDVLKSSISDAYGNIYSQRYEQLKQALDTRYHTGTIEFEGGVEI